MNNRYAPISKNLFQSHRKKLVSGMDYNSLCVLVSNDIMPTNADGSMGFRQNTNLFYLTGIDQEDTALILCPGHKNPKMRELLFIRESNEHIKVWEGEKLSKSEAEQISGISTIYWRSQFETILESLMSDFNVIYLDKNEHSRADKTVETASDRLIHYCQEKYPLHRYGRLAPILANLRVIKSDIEIALMQQACNITEKAFRRVLQFTRPGVYEFEIEAEILHEFYKNRSRYAAYSSIIASGKNANILHYVQNNAVCKDGELILMDFGAEYGNYAADLTRCIPVNGKFSKRQKEVYKAVQNTMEYAADLLVPGITWEEYMKEVGHYISYEMVNLKLFSKKELAAQDKNNPLYKKYFMHGISHYLGLDVHDVGDRNTPMREGMVLTVEPGIYIPEEGLGIRLENNFYIRKKKALDLMGNIPLNTEEIESLMRKPKKE